MKTKDRRISKRSPIKVLVKCLPAKTSARRGRVTKAWKMLARDIGDDGVRLHWSRAWSSLNCPHCLRWTPQKSSDENQLCLCSPPQESLQIGQWVELDGLIYTEQGSPSLRGLIRWIRPDKKGERYDFGVRVTSPRHRDYFRTLEAV